MLDPQLLEGRGCACSFSVPRFCIYYTYVYLYTHMLFIYIYTCFAYIRHQEMFIDYDTENINKIKDRLAITNELALITVCNQK